MQCNAMQAGGDPSDPTFRELIVRWFQYGMTCPLFRQHGARATEIWGYGNVSEAIIADTIKLRTTFEPYIMEQMAAVSQTGQPVKTLMTHPLRFLLTRGH